MEKGGLNRKCGALAWKSLLHNRKSRVLIWVLSLYIMYIKASFYRIDLNKTPLFSVEILNASNNSFARFTLCVRYCS